MLNKKPIVIALGLIVLLLAVFKLTFVKVRLDQVGVKVNNVSGIIPGDLPPGYYFVLPGLHRIHLMDPTVQAFHMSESSNADAKSLRLVGKDQYLTRFEITILYRIAEGKAHRIAQEIGTDANKAREVLRSKADKVLWDELGKLDTQEFYDVVKREAAREDVKKELAVELEPLNLELVDVLIRSIEYDPNLEAILVKKQLIDQNREFTIEKAKLEGELEKTQAIEQQTSVMVRIINEKKIQEIANIEAETDSKVRQIEADAQLKAQTMVAEADRHRRTKISEGELAKTEAQAKGDRAMNDAYRATGGDAYITRLMIDSLEFGEIEVNTNKVNPFDVEQLLGMLGMESK
ncbi:MAG: SPFH domain-containing protein [Planctomycetes bacterium]|nr:SPFH domain-containing protein [Planctomycetota bacterium]